MAGLSVFFRGLHYTSRSVYKLNNYTKTFVVLVIRTALQALELVSRPIAGGRERGAPRPAAAPSPVTSACRREEAVGLFADRTRA